ncbi:bifunctional UDP-N-acetylglucosamine diphosphorylase/glucosamine-1-phosphate N-acetyltransferase GlmU [bacterium]|nr:bifunctional UDP-N-acetylglucosamine diphosphorylase/glucosamine-1-phosphate N-acetyltransferase GlmU [bacterium]
MKARAAVILAAGKGTRMRSPRPKVLHEVGGRTLLAWSVALATDLRCERIVVVVGPDAGDVSTQAARLVGAENVVVQREQQGTANAVDAARGRVADFPGDMVVLYADTPLIPATAVEAAFAEVAATRGVCVIGFEACVPGGYGRLILGPEGDLERIVEAKDATPVELAVSFCNSGIMAGPAALMYDLVSKVGNENKQGEYYLTDVVALARGRDLAASATPCAEADVQGVNSQAELAAVEAAFQSRMRERSMTDGVTLSAPETVYFSWDTRLAPGVTVEQHVVFGVKVDVAAGARIRAFSHLEGAQIAEGAIVGPYARLRPGAVIGRDVHIGNFVEVKNVRVGEGAKANHLSYLGDGDIGAGANIGAGTIFCNYDGYFKYRTVIGEGAFIGSNTSLVAPVTLGPGAYIGSGSVVTKDVAADALGVARGRQIDRQGWAKTFRDRQSARKKAGDKPEGAV